jgi:hypothetical protein
MYSTGIFTIQYYKIPVKKSDETYYLFPFGDIHRTSPGCHVEKWKEFLAWAKRKGRSHFIGMGDYLDIMSTSERDIFSNRNIHDSTADTLNMLYMKQTEDFAEEIKFMEGRLIGLLEGNHFAVLKSGITTTQYLCQLLNCKYLGCSSFIRISFPYAQNSSSIDIWAHHGRGAARLIGGSLNRVQQMAEAASANLFLMAHDHKKSAGTASKLMLSGNGENMKLRHQKQLFVRTGSFLKGYEPEKASYVADSALNPSDLGVVKIEMTPKRKHESYSIDLHASI